MQSKRDSDLLRPDSNGLNRRQLLQALGALVATSACGAGNEGATGNASGAPNGGRASGGASSAGGSDSKGGDVVNSGANTGGANVGGVPSSAANAGGSSTGGSFTDGSNVGGTSTGGTSAGGTNTGGTNAGGTTTGTTGKGGTSNGGKSTGGSNTGSDTKGGTSASGANAGGTSSGNTNRGGTNSGIGGEGTAGESGNVGSLVAPSFDNVPTCTASNTDAAGQGPFIIHDKEKSDDISLYRQDIRGRYNQDAAPGVEMQLHLRVLDATSANCNGTPVEDIDVYIWHTDGQGYYSGFGTPGGADEQHPDAPYAGVPSSANLENTMRFCRGIQTTNKDGVVSFRSIFPGWYNGRDIHIHFVAFKRDSTARGRVDYNKQNSQNQWLFTTQCYFDPALSRSVHENNEPYRARTTGSLATVYQGAVKADESGNSGLRAKATLVNGVVVAQMQILLNPA